MYLEDHRSGSEDKSQTKLHGQAALAFVKGLDHIAAGALKGGVVAFPLALAEGFRNAPRLWGETVKEQAEITGWRSGTAVACKVRVEHIP